MKKLFLILSAIFLFFGCGGNEAKLPISVSLSPSAQTTIDQGQTLNFTATVANDSSNSGVSWSMSGTSCSGTACGTFSNKTTGAATYAAPGSVSANMTVTITATSIADSSKTMASTVVVTPAPSITTTSLASGTVGTAYSATLQASGGAGTLAWSLASGSSLPAGLALSGSGGISGTPTTGGTTNFTVKVTDSSGGQSGPVSATQQLSITIKSLAPSITTTSLSNGVVGSAYSASLTSTGGTGTINWSVTSGSLPGGLSLSSAGDISGTPTTAGTSTFTVTATDSGSPPQTANQSLTLTINARLIITTTSLPNDVVSTAYSATLQSSGGVGAITWTVSSGSLPAGLSMKSTGVISGTPTAAGTSNFTVQATDSGTPQQSVQQALSIAVYSGLTITTTSLPNGTVNVAYSAALQSAGGTPPISWSVTQGGLPAGLTPSSSGTITGTPTAAGASSFTVTASDSSSPPQTKSQALSITITASLSITTTSLPAGTVGSAYSQNIQTSGGTQPISWSVTTGSLPAGLTLTAGSNGVGVISGTPTALGSNPFTVTATDSSSPPQSKSQALSITITAALSITTTSLPAGTVGSAYSQNIQTSGGTQPISWSVTTGSLPAGLTLTAGSNGVGVISGTPTAYGSDTFTVTATDSSSPPQVANQQFTLVINNVALSITTTSLTGATVGTAYSAALDASGGTPPYTWTVATGSALPTWLTLSGSGTNWKLTGTPSAAGTANFSLTVTDSSTPTPQTQTAALSITTTGSSTACGTGNEKVLQGQYAFTLTGFNSSGFQATIGSFTADGAGHISAGIMDANGVSPGVNSGNISASGSSYSVGSDGRGCATIETPFYTYTTRFALAPTSSVASGGTVQEWESGSSALIASGQIFLQSVPTAFPSGTFVLQFSGIYGESWMAAVGTGTGSGGQFTNGEYDINVAGTPHTYTGAKGTYGTPDPTTGRVTVTGMLKSTTAAAYLVSSSYWIALTGDTAAKNTLVATGSGQLQNSSFGLTAGQNLVFYATGLQEAEFSVVTNNGSGTLSASIYQDIGGVWTSPTPSTASCDFQIDSYGRVETSGDDCGLYFNGTSWSYPPVFYLSGPNTGVMMGTTDPGVLLGQLEPQQATAITAGDYYVGTQSVTGLSVNETLTGVAAITSSGTGSGTISGTIDSTSLGTPEQGGKPLSTTLTVNADGTFSTSNYPGTIMGVIISGSQLIQVDGQASSYPTMLVINGGTGE